MSNVVDINQQLEQKMIKEFRRLLALHGGIENQNARRIAGGYIRQRLQRGAKIKGLEWLSQSSIPLA